MIEGRGNDSGGDEAADVRHVSEKPGAVVITDLPHAFVVDESRVGRGARHDEFGAEEFGILFHLVIVNDSRGLIQTIGEGLKEDRHGGDLLTIGLVAMGEVSSMGKIECHDAVMRSKDGSIGLEVGGRSRERLNVDSPLRRVEIESF